MNRADAERLTDAELTVEPPRPTGLERFAAMSPEEQDAAVGKEAAEKIRTGEISLEELVARDTIHGERVITQKPLEEV
jgi:hypothetical protein